MDGAWKTLLALALLSGCGARSSLLVELESDQRGGGAGGGAGSGLVMPAAGGGRSVGGPAPGGTGGAVGGSGALAGAGGAGGAPGPIEFGLIFGEVPSVYEVHDLAVHPDGQVAIAVSGYEAVIAFGKPTSLLTPAGDWDGFVASFTNGGTPVWAQSFGGSLQDRTRSIAFDPSGSLLMTGIADSLGVTLTKLDGMGGLQWSKIFDNADGFDVATASDGSIAITGTLPGEYVEFDTCILAPEELGSHTFVARFDADGQCSWAHFFDSQGSEPSGIAIDSAGNVIVAGAFEAPIDFGQGPVSPQGVYDSFISKFSPSGELLLTRTFSSDGARWPPLQGLAIDSQDQIVIVGNFDGTLDLGAGEIEDSNALYAAKFDGDGNLLWSNVADGVAMAYDVAIDPADNVLVAGQITSGGGGASSETDALVLKLGPDGAKEWARTITGSGEQIARAIGSDGAGNVFVVGQFFLGIDFGQGERIGTGTVSNIFLAKLAP